MLKFLIVMLCFNVREIVDVSIVVVVVQICWDWELICVDDGLSDGMLQCL